MTGLPEQRSLRLSYIAAVRLSHRLAGRSVDLCLKNPPHCFLSVEKCTCYTFHWRDDNSHKSWTESRRKCNETAADLVSMETKGEWEFILEKIEKRKGRWSNEWYIGLEKQGNGAWTWVSGERLQNNVKGKWPWQPHEPNGYGDVAVMARSYPRGTRGLFNDLNKVQRKGFICEKVTGWCLFAERIAIV